MKAGLLGGTKLKVFDALVCGVPLITAFILGVPRP